MSVKDLRGQEANWERDRSHVCFLRGQEANWEIGISEGRRGIGREMGAMSGGRRQIGPRKNTVSVQKANFDLRRESIRGPHERQCSTLTTRPNKSNR